MMHKKIWESHICRSPLLSQPVDLMFARNGLKERVDLEQRYWSGAKQDIAIEEYPEYIFFSLYDLRSKKKDSLPDIFAAKGGLLIVSGALHDLLQQFELGKTRFKEVPLFEYDQETQREGRWYFMHIREDRRTHVPEQSTGLEPVGENGQKWTIFLGFEYQVAVNPHEAVDLDLWHDSCIRTSTFFSDRLRKAISSAGLKTRRMGFKACKVIAV